MGLEAELLGLGPLMPWTACMHDLTFVALAVLSICQAEIGVDAGAYARLLMVHAKEAADAAADDVVAGTLSAQAILESAFYRTNVQGEQTAHSHAAMVDAACRESRGLLVRAGGCHMPAAHAPAATECGCCSAHPHHQANPSPASGLLHTYRGPWQLSSCVLCCGGAWVALCCCPLTLRVACSLALPCAGSSTACVLVVNGTTLSASNLGDSGFVLVRDGVATFQCPQQQHNFNFPFQLGSADSMSDQPQAAMVSGRGAAAVLALQHGGHEGGHLALIRAWGVVARPCGGGWWGVRLPRGGLE